MILFKHPAAVIVCDRCKTKIKMVADSQVEIVARLKEQYNWELKKDALLCEACKDAVQEP